MLPLAFLARQEITHRRATAMRLNLARAEDNLADSDEASLRGRRACAGRVGEDRGGEGKAVDGDGEEGEGDEGERGENE